MNFPPAKPGYSQGDEQSFRTTLASLLQFFRRTDVAVDFVLMTDSVTGEPGKLTIQSGTPTWTAL